MSGRGTTAALRDEFDCVTILRALAQRKRTRILEVLLRQSSTVQDLAFQLHLRQPDVSKNLRILREAGIVECVSREKRRCYQIVPVLREQDGCGALDFGWCRFYFDEFRAESQ
jgi:DNA-binding transcriptional ArsR family regulator